VTSKSELQTVLKDQYGINKNLTQALSLEDCENLLILLNNYPSAGKLVESFVGKNNELAQNNRYYGQRRQQAERRLERLQAEYKQTEQAIATLEKENAILKDRWELLSDEQRTLEAQVAQLDSYNQSLSSRVQTLTSENDQLVQANDQLKRDNKDLKNIVDQIRLRLARDTNMLLQYEDSELRKAIIRLFRWTLG
jgi:chromosome segregation ATPase